jgi:hypothetical protein
LKKTLIIVSIVIIASAIFYYLKYYYERDKVDIWELVPKNTIAIYETDQPIKVWNSFLELPMWNNLSSVPEINEINEDLVLLDSITGSSGNLERLFRDKEMLISIHKTSNIDFGMIFYITLNTGEKREILNRIISFFKNIQSFQYEVRNYEDFTIHELSDDETNNNFTFIEYKNHFVGSFTPFLIDDVVRNISNNFQTNFLSVSSGIFDAKPIEMDEGNLYINVVRIPGLLRNLTLDEGRSSYNEYIKWFSGATYYDVSFEDNRIFFNGSTRIPENNGEYFLSTFYNQSPQDIEAIYYLPNRTANYISYTFDDFISWRKSVDIFWEKNFPEVFNRKIQLLKNYSIYEKDFYGWIGNEIGLATLQSMNLDHPDKLLMIKSKDYSKSIKVLDELIMVVNHQESDTLLYEDFSGKRIKQLSIPELPASIFGEEFLGFENSYYTDLGSYIVIGNSFDVVKHLLSEIDNENTWGKSLKFMQYFENVQRRANVNYFINFSNAWNAFLGSLNPDWGEFFKEFDREFKHFELISFQFSNINNNFYTSAAVQHRQETSVIATPSEFFKDQLVVTDYPIITKPYIFRSHLDRNLEVMFQDAGNQLYFISSNGKVLWKKQVGEPVKSDIFQVDYYKNGKLQYLFASDSNLYIYDRNGNILRNFPVSLEHPVDLDYLNLIDYDNSRNYRYLICDRSGDIYLTNKDGKELEGWMPRKTGGQNMGAPFHIRISGRDCMLSVRGDGILNVMNRRSEMYDGFPVALESAITSPVFVQKGVDFNRSVIHLVNNMGEVIKVNLNGDITGKVQLYRRDEESKFKIVPDALRNTYVISRQDFNNVAILDQKGDTVFEEELVFTGDLEVQFYNFSAGNEVYVFTDSQQGFTYLFDGNGNMINMQPVESGFKIGLLYSEVTNKYKMYTCYGNQFSVLSFYKK